MKTRHVLFLDSANRRSLWAQVIRRATAPAPARKATWMEAARQWLNALFAR